MDDTQTISLITNSISNFGFPIAITAYLLTRFEKKIDGLNSSILELTQTLRGVQNKNHE
ncbi:YvrJ family protein [Paenibacillus ehimensis]|uniref:YvrJ family protein n=1 Tax=Paenibacillus ehimensis TaxID=79264 RepID=UPI002C2F97EE|nr:YvrJ family protein [Paenibacillus ehimensis]MEC0208637.1 YvrJ family protein [Paenibacillus ehimensis]HWO95593.1 YvrJ family protein [Bacillus sp. (in: firmicutes)]